MSGVRFRGPIAPAGRGGSYVAVPADVREALGARGRTSVTGTIDGFAISGQVMPYSFPDVGKAVVLGITKATRAAIGKEVGDEVEVELVRDDTPRSAVKEIPAELRAALDRDEVARAGFERLAPSHRREHAQHVAEAKQPATRERRAERVIAELRGRGSGA
jgi:bifunctional DNA-binding transcriptional regulator/antitoxin component of YhaV-PrlF toxin-antitoxin module